MTKDEYNAIRDLIYNAYKTQYKQEELKRLAEFDTPYTIIALIKYDDKYYRVGLIIQPSEIRYG